MHESGLIEDLIFKAEAVAREHSAQKITVVEVSIGALAGIEPEHLREHFEMASRGTLAEGAELRFREAGEGAGRDPMGIFLESVELEG
jgi:hydrogenase nickel incorporation protein HypA/HybF